VCDLPPDWRVLALSDHCAVQAWEAPARRMLGVQFHPEMDEVGGNAEFRKSAEMLAENGVDAEELVASTRDDGARVLFARFLVRNWP
jgi:GMP synthase-like glutamine amidotransferase